MLREGGAGVVSLGSATHGQSKTKSNLLLHA